jgi:Delta14-sterol reductase
MTTVDDGWISCILFTVTLYSVIVAVHVLCPARLVEGYVCDIVVSSRPLHYRLNGFRCFWIIVGGFLLLHHGLQWKRATLFLQQHYWECATVSNAMGILVSIFFVYIRFPYFLSPEQKRDNAMRRAPTVSLAAVHRKKNDDEPNNNNDSDGNALDERSFHFFNGREFNPRLSLEWIDHRWWPLMKIDHHGGDKLTPSLDVKMVLYTFCLVLELNILSALFLERELRGSNSNGMILYATLFTWFLLDYLWYEEVHLYTYDLFAEKVGFKLIWGCFCFYPFFYPIGMLPFMAMPVVGAGENELSPLSMILITVVYVTGSVLTRGANMQKFHFRRSPQQKEVILFGGLLVLSQETVPSSNNRLLCSGFWGLSRHVNYFGEILQAVGLALPGWLHVMTVPSDSAMSSTTLGAMLPILPWLYPLYYVALFIPRQMEDEAIMKQKYGNEVMDEYCAIVPYRMVPVIY